MHDFEGRIPGMEAIHSSSGPTKVPMYIHRPDGKRVEIGYADVDGETFTGHFSEELHGLDDQILRLIRGDLLSMSFRTVPTEAEHLLLEVKEATALPEPPMRHISIAHLFKDTTIEETP